MLLKKFALGFCIAASSIGAHAAVGDAGAATNVTVDNVVSLLNVNQAWIKVSPTPAECDYHPYYGGPKIVVPLTSESGRLAASIALTAKSTSSNVDVQWDTGCTLKNITINP